MSYNVYLNDPVTGETLELDAPHQMKGGTFEIGGSYEAWLNVTCNYGKILHMVLGEEGLKILAGKTGAETLPILKAAAEKLSDNVSSNYWEPTQGNVKRAILSLAAMAKMRPDGVWQVNQ